MTGITGPTGPQGDKGDKGDIGVTGITGPTGPQGDKGDNGDIGVTGITGPTGPQGDKGDKGDIGVTGITGPTGPQGDKGDKGDIGVTGITGPSGPQGDKGDNGDIGVTGITGPTGPQGDKGDKGDIGVTGITGPAGPSGPKGDKGDIGVTGITGPAGPSGPKGDKGDQGSTGVTGPIGGNNTQIIYNKSGVAAGNANLWWDETNLTLNTHSLKIAGRIRSINEKSNTVNLVAGNTYTIAWTDNSEAAEGIFHLMDNTSGVRAGMYFCAGYKYSNSQNITVLYKDNYSTNYPFSKIQFFSEKEPDTGVSYKGAVLQVVARTNVTSADINLLFDFSAGLWKTVAFEDAANVPTGCTISPTDYSTFIVSHYLDIPDGRDTVIATTGNIHLPTKTLYSGTIQLDTAPEDPGSNSMVNLGLHGSGGLRVRTNAGYLDIGPNNTGYCHINTDRDQYYINKRILLATGELSSYNNTALILSTNNGTNNHMYITPGATSMVGVGNTSPGYTLDVKGDINFSGDLYQNGNPFSSGSSSGYVYIYDSSATLLGPRKTALLTDRGDWVDPANIANQRYDNIVYGVTNFNNLNALKWTTITLPANQNTLPANQQIVLRSSLLGAVVPGFMTNAPIGESTPVDCVLEGRFIIDEETPINGANINGVVHDIADPTRFASGFTFSVGITTRIQGSRGATIEELVRHDMHIPFRTRTTHCHRFSCNFSFNMTYANNSGTLHDYTPFYVHNGCVSNGKGGGTDGIIRVEICKVTITTKPGI